MKKITLCILCVFTVLLASTQNVSSDYKTAIGIKVFPTAVSAKHFIKDQNAVEGLLYLWDGGSRLTALYEVHGNINPVEGLKWYIGGGGHIGYWNDRWVSKNPSSKTGVNIGVDGVLGVDYKVKGAPINISFDWQPSLNVIGDSWFEAGWGGLGIRFAF